MLCPKCSSEIQMGARFCSACGQRVAPEWVPVQQQVAQAGLYRPLLGRMIGGVCAGIAQRYGWDVAVVRLALVAAVLVGCGFPVIGYIVAWIVMPSEPLYVGAPMPPAQPMAPASPPQA